MAAANAVTVIIHDGEFANSSNNLLSISIAAAIYCICHTIGIGESDCLNYVNQFEFYTLFSTLTLSHSLSLCVSQECAAFVEYVSGSLRSRCLTDLS